MTRRNGGGPARDVVAMAQAAVVPASLVPPATDEHARLAAVFLGSLPGDERSRPGARALAATAASLTVAIEDVSRALAARGSVGGDGKANPLTRTLASLTSAQIAALRAMRALPTTDARVIRQGATFERFLRGGRDLAPAPGEPGGPVLDYVALLAHDDRKPRP